MSSQLSIINSSPSVELHIEELVLHGFPSGDRHRIGAAVKQELKQLFAERGVSTKLTRDSAREKIEGGSFKMTANSTAEVVGVKIAQAIHGRLTR